MEIGFTFYGAQSPGLGSSLEVSLIRLVTIGCTHSAIITSQGLCATVCSAFGQCSASGAFMATLHGHPRWSFHLCTLAQGFLHCRGAKGGKWSQEDRAVISECHSRTRLLSGSMTRGSRQGHWSRDQQPKGKLSPCGCREAAQVSREDLDVKGFLSTSRQLFKFMGVWGLLVLVLVWLSLSHPAFLSMIQRPTGLIS